MEKIKIVYLPKVENYLFDLVLVLFNKDYFSYIENAEEYNYKIIDFIEEKIASFLLRKLL